MTDPMFDVALVLAQDRGEDTDALVVSGGDLVAPVTICVAPAEDREPYDQALRAAGFAPVGDEHAVRA